MRVSRETLVRVALRFAGRPKLIDIRSKLVYMVGSKSKSLESVLYKQRKKFYNINEKKYFSR